jgi:hypothetical protein
MIEPHIYADFHNADTRGRVRLNCVGTVEDLARQQVQLREGLTLTLYSDDADVDGKFTELQVPGVVEYSKDERCWVAVIDWTAIQHVPAQPSERDNGTNALGPVAAQGKVAR